jgi:hypothetical protein
MLVRKVKEGSIIDALGWLNRELFASDVAIVADSPRRGQAELPPSC